MALDNLKDVKEIGGCEVSHFHVEHLATNHPPVSINHGINGIFFRFRNGLTSGCTVDTLIEAAKLILEGLNKETPHINNATAILKLEAALDALRKKV